METRRIVKSIMFVLHFFLNHPMKHFQVIDLEGINGMVKINLSSFLFKSLLMSFMCQKDQSDKTNFLDYLRWDFQGKAFHVKINPYTNQQQIFQDKDVQLCYYSSVVLNETLLAKLRRSCKQLSLSPYVFQVFKLWLALDCKSCSGFNKVLITTSVHTTLPYETIFWDVKSWCHQLSTCRKFCVPAFLFCRLCQAACG